MEQIIDSMAAIWNQQGGLTRLSKMLGVPVTTVHAWKRRGRVPSWRQGQIEEALRLADEFKAHDNGGR